MTDHRTALITGITGQDGSYLAELLLSKGYAVHGTVRRTSRPNHSHIQHLSERITLHPADLTDAGSLERLLADVDPDEVYNLAAQSFVPASFTQPLATAEITALGTTRLLEAIRNSQKPIRFYQASSSEMFGKVAEIPQTERTPFYPRSPYGAAKLYSHWMTINYRESYDMFCVSGILFNHESERRGVEFVTRKISRAVARIKLGLQDVLELGNMEARRDWSHAADCVEAMWLMLQQDYPDDFVISSGVTRSVREFTEAAFSHVGLDYNDYVIINPKFYRPSEVDILRGDCTKAREVLGWQPRVSFQQLVQRMVDNDLQIESQIKGSQGL